MKTGYFKKRVTGLILVLGLFFSGCSGWLEMKPLDQTNGDGFWVSETSVQQTVAGAYALLRRALMTGDLFMVYGENMDITLKHKTKTNQEKFDDMSFWNPDMAEFMWGNFFKTIAQCNLIIYKSKEMDNSLFTGGEKGKQKLLGEALFIRAFTYFYMAKVWGDVPLVTEPTLTVSEVITSDGYVKNVPKNPELDILNQCITDLKLAEGYLEYGVPGSKEWAVQANKGSVQALMADVYLWMHKSSEAELAADKVITKGGYSLVNYADTVAVGKLFTGRSSEGIFELNCAYAQSESYMNGIATNTLYSPWLYNRAESGGTWNVQKAYVASLYEASDLRIKRFFGYWSTARPIILKYANIVYEDVATFYNPHGNSNVLLFRLSGIMLLRAEALANLGRFAEAQTLLNTIRTRSNASPYSGTGTALQYMIFQERQRELIGEGHTYFDRIRSDTWTGITWMSSSRKALKGYYWPIASVYIINNPLLTQNAFWASKNY